MEDGRFVKVAQGGGDASSDNGRVRVHFGSNALDNDIRVRVKPVSPADAPARVLGGHAFEVVAADESSFANLSATPTSTPTPSDTPTSTPTDIQTGTLPDTLTSTPTSTSTDTLTDTPPSIPSNTPTEISTDSLINTTTDTPTTTGQAPNNAGQAPNNAGQAGQAEHARRVSTDQAPSPTPSSQPGNGQGGNNNHGQNGGGGRGPQRQYLHKFRNTFNIEVQYNPAEVNGNEGALLLYYWDTSTNQWIALPTTVDAKNHILRATTDHLTVFDYQASSFEAARLPSMKSWQTSLFTGAASYSMPLWVPPGPGGLQPSLALSYNSQSVDSASSYEQASWVGMGWNLGAGGSIVRDTHNTTDFTGDDSFSLTVGGVGGLLLPGADGYMHTQDESFWRILYNASSDSWTAWDQTGNVYTFASLAKTPIYSGCNAPTMQTWQWSLTSVTNIYGQTLAYTYAKDSQTAQDACGTNPAALDLAVYPQTIVYPNSRYRVKFVTAADRTDYLVNWTQASSRVPYEKQRLAEVRVEQDADGDGTFETLMHRYVFNFESNPANRVFPGVQWPYSCGAACALYQGELTLTGVTEYGTDGTSALPATTFGYSNSRLAWGENGYGGRVEFTYDATPWSDVSGPAPVDQRCEAVNTDNPVDAHTNFDGWTNGLCNSLTPGGTFQIYGGQTQSVNYSLMPYFQPGAAYRIQMTAYGCAGCNATLAEGYNDGNQTTFDQTYTLPNDGSAVNIDYTFVLSPNASQLQLYLKGNNSNWSIGSYKITPLMTRYRVQTKTVKDGVSASPDVYTYQYVGAASNDPAHSALAGTPYATAYNKPYSEFRGHNQVTEIDPNGSYSVSVFNQSDGLAGRTQQSWVQNAGGFIYSKTINNVSFDNTLPLAANSSLMPHKKDGTVYADLLRYWVYDTSSENRTYNNDGSYNATRSDFQYAAADQGGTQYGNRTSVTESAWNGGSFVPYRWTHTRYFPTVTSSLYLTGLAGIQEEYSCPGGSCTTAWQNLIGSTWSLYDSATNYATPPSAGKLTGKRALVSQIDANTALFSDAQYAYDGWGNVTAATGYSSYGTYSSPATGGASTTSTTYDSTYHTYAVSTTNALGQTTTTSYNYTLAAPVSQTNPNGATTSVSYDVFGRLTQVNRPGDNGFLAVTYNDTARPYWIGITQKIDNSTNYVVRKFYDGVGRLIQTQNVNAPVAGVASTLITNAAYFSQTGGGYSWQSVPYADNSWTGSGNPYRTPDWNQPKTVSTQDILGRTVQTLGTDGQVSGSAAYNGLATVSTDALGRNTTTLKDVWGKIVQVTPAAGPGVSYQYDAAGNLRYVATGGFTTEIRYDQAGRKTWMSDPDMGVWTYQYDAAGNLTLQSDARGCTISMAYDSLGRLTGKTYAGPDACGSTPSVTFQYDSTSNGNYGVGQRTGMTDGSGATNWKFDLRGRLIEELKTISGGGSYRTQHGYNSADEEIWTAYPGGASGEVGERVDEAYNAQMQLQSMHSETYGANYVQQTSYDAAGRVTSRVLGDNNGTNKQITNAYTYYPWTIANGDGRLQRVTTGTDTNLTSLQDLRYAYDAVGNILSIQDYTGEAPSVQTAAYTYDNLDRLLTANVAGGVNGLYSETYTYDTATGNLTSKAGVHYSYGDALHAHAVTSLDNGNAYTYDAAGNQVTRQVGSDSFTLVYDAEGRLVQVNKNTTSGSAGGAVFAQYTYDGQGKLVLQVEHTTSGSAGGKTTVIVSNLAEIEMTGTATATATSTGQAPSPTNTASATPTPTGTWQSPTPSSTPVPTSTNTPAPDTWTFCANEGDTCTVPGTTTVRYGALFVYSSLLVTDSIACTNAAFGGDPIPFIPKHCDYSNGSAAPTATPAPTAVPPTSTLTLTPTITSTPTVTSTPLPANGLLGEYYYNSNLTWLETVRTDPNIYFNWGGASPAIGVPATNWSARWTGYVQPRYSETYTFTANHDDGARVWVNDQLIIDSWGAVGATSGTITLNAGQKYSLRVEYLGITEPNYMYLYWSSPTQAKEIIPQSQLFPRDNFVTNTPKSTNTSTSPNTPIGTLTFTPTKTKTPTSTNTPTVSAGYGLLGEYYYNSNLTWLETVRTDPNIYFNWGGASPAIGVPAANWSARWTGYVQPRYSETYTFTANHDDGARVWVNDQLIIDSWSAVGATSGTIALNAGQKYSLRVEYLGITEPNYMYLYWSSPTQAKEIIPQSQLYMPNPMPTPTATLANGTGLTGQYFASTNLTSLKITRTDLDIHFYWGSASPATGVPATNWSARWTGYVQPRYSETYTFTANHDDGARVWVNDQLIIDSWGAVGATSGTIALNAGQKYSLRVEYLGITEPNYMYLYWSSLTQAKEIIPQSQLFPDLSIPTSTPIGTLSATPTITGQANTATQTNTPMPTVTSSPTATATATPQTPNTLPAGQTWKFYYYAGGQRIAERVVSGSQNQLTYMMGNNVGSTSVVADASGNKVAEMRYKPFGETSYSSGDPQTSYHYTGQREDSYINLIQMGARWYDPAIGRFVSADTIVSQPGNPQTYDRFAYVDNNPINYSDPTGHCSTKYSQYDGPCGSITTESDYHISQSIDTLRKYGAKVVNPYSWDEYQLATLTAAVEKTGAKMATATGGTAEKAFKNAFGYLNFCLNINGSCPLSNSTWAGERRDYHTILFNPQNLLAYVGEPLTMRVIMHELGHVLSARLYSVQHGYDGHDNPVQDLIDQGIYADDGTLITGKGTLNGGRNTSNQKYFPYYGMSYAGLDHEALWSSDHAIVDEEWADIFMNWDDGTFNKNWGGYAINDWVDRNIAGWVKWY